MKVIPETLVKSCDECLHEYTARDEEHYCGHREGPGLLDDSYLTTIHPDCPLYDAPEPLKRPCFDGGGDEYPENCDDATGMDCTHKEKDGHWETCTSGKLNRRYGKEGSNAD